VAVLGAYLWYTKMRNDRKKVDKVPQGERTDYLLTLADKYRINVNNLTKEHQYNVVMTTLKNRMTFRLSVLIFLLVIALFLMIYGLFQHRSSNGIEPIEKISVNVHKNGELAQSDIQIRFVNSNKYKNFRPGEIDVKDIPGDSNHNINFKIAEKGYRIIDETFDLQRDYKFELERLTYWIAGPNDCDQSGMKDFREFFADHYNGSWLMDESSQHIINIGYSPDIENTKDDGKCIYKVGNITVSSGKTTTNLHSLKLFNHQWNQVGGIKCNILQRLICDSVNSIVNRNNEIVADAILTLDKSLLE
jgi:hypothetical protein